MLHSVYLRKPLELGPSRKKNTAEERVLVDLHAPKLVDSDWSRWCTEMYREEKNHGIGRTQDGNNLNCGKNQSIINTVLITKVRTNTKKVEKNNSFAKDFEKKVNPQFGCRKFGSRSAVFEKKPQNLFLYLILG